MRRLMNTRPSLRTVLIAFFMSWMTLGGVSAQANLNNPYLFCGFLNAVTGIGWEDCRQAWCAANDGATYTAGGDGLTVTFTAGVDLKAFNINPCPEYMPDCEISVSLLWFSVGLGCSTSGPG